MSSGVRRVVIGCKDPNPKVAGRGVEVLEAAGVEVEVSVCGWVHLSSLTSIIILTHLCCYLITIFIVITTHFFLIEPCVSSVIGVVRRLLLLTFNSS